MDILKIFKKPEKIKEIKAQPFEYEDSDYVDALILHARAQSLLCQEKKEDKRKG